jgi:hypothetical protein
MLATRIAIAPAYRLHPPIQDDHQRDGADCRKHEEDRRNDRGKDKIAALEDARRILEEEDEDGLERGSQTGSPGKGHGRFRWLGRPPGARSPPPTVYAVHRRMVRHPRQRK